MERFPSQSIAKESLGAFKSFLLQIPAEMKDHCDIWLPPTYRLLLHDSYTVYVTPLSFIPVTIKLFPCAVVVSLASLSLFLLLVYCYCSIRIEMQFHYYDVLMPE